MTPTSDGQPSPTSIRSRAEAYLRRSDGTRRLVDRGERAVAHAVAAVVPGHLMRNKRLFDIWERHGYYVVPAHFYEPLPDRRDVAAAVGTRSELVGVDLAPDRQLQLLAELRRWQSEYDAFPHTPAESEDGFYVGNSLFGSVDAEVLYALVRHLQPRRLFEIGSGFSTLVSARACRANEHASGRTCELVSFEPYPNDALLGGVDGLTRIERHRLQESLSRRSTGSRPTTCCSSTRVMSSRLAVTCAASSSRSCPGSRRASSSTSTTSSCRASTRESGSRDSRYFWTEQYLLQAFLAFNDSFEILWAGQYMHLERPEALQEAFSSYDPVAGSPGSFWFRRAR